MHVIFENVLTQYHRLSDWLHRQARSGEVWQPRCYVGDPYWQTPRRQHEFRR